MIKYYYLRCLTKVAKDENIKPYQVKGHLENGFRVMWLAYSPLFWKGLYFDASAVFKNMAQASGLTEQELRDIFRQYITDGFASKYRKLWERAAEGKPFTPIRLISSLWEKFEAQIVPLHMWDLFGRLAQSDQS